MKPHTTHILAAVLLAALCTAGCTTAPEPVKEPGWDQSARSAAKAPPTAAASTAQTAQDAAQRVVAGAISTTDAETSTGGSPSALQGEPVEVIPFDSPKFRTEAPGPDQSARDVAAWLAAARRKGKSGQWLKSQLDKNKPARLSDSRLSWMAGDFNTDGRDDLAAIFFGGCADPACSEGGRWHVVVVWGGDGWSPIGQSRDHRPEFVGPVDLTGDGRPELVVSLTQCGAHTCYEDLRAYSSHGARDFRQVLHLGEDGQGYGGAGLPQNVELEQPDDELPRLVVSGGLVGSVGAGPFQRSSRSVWGWNGDTGRIEQISVSWAPSKLRLHRLHDAIVALEDQRPNEAAARLWEVIEDDQLRELPDGMGTDDELSRTLRAQLTQVARFLLARIALGQDEPAAVDQHLGELSTSAPQSPATQATRKLLAEWRSSANLSRACQVAATVFPNARGDDWLLDSHQLGYNAPVKFDASRDNGLCAGL